MGEGWSDPGRVDPTVEGGARVDEDGSGGRPELRPGHPPTGPGRPRLRTEVESRGVRGPRVRPGGPDEDGRGVTRHREPADIPSVFTVTTDIRVGPGTVLLAVGPSEWRRRIAGRRVSCSGAEESD